MLKRHRGKSDGETCTKYSQQNTTDLTIAAMAASRAALNDPLNFPCFRAMLQLLPAFSDRSREH
jgi:hypothetical protein